MQKKLVVIGSCNTDLVIKTSHLPQPGETIIGHNFMTNQGGKGANQAIAASKMGNNVIFASCVGDDDFGHQAIKLLQQTGLDPQYITVHPNASTGIAMIAVDEKGENSIIVASGANALLSPKEIDKLAKLIKEETSVILMQLETPLPTLIHAAQIAHQAGVKVVLNPAPYPNKSLPPEFLQNIDLIIPNETEASRMTGLPVETEEQMLQAMKTIQQQGVSHVIITAGKAGSYTLNDGKLFHQEAYPVRAIDTTAAGDTYCGVLCAALRDGHSLQDSMKRASTAASLSTTRMGAWPSIPTKEEVENALISNTKNLKPCI